MDNMEDMKFPSEEELAEKLYKYCQANNIEYIREDELIRSFLEDEMKSGLATLEENYDLDEKGYGKDEESSRAVTMNLANFYIFAYKVGKHFYDMIDILIEECKAHREKIDGERPYYLTFFLYPRDVESMKLIKSTVEIFSEELYNYCKENNLECLKKDEVGDIIKIDDNKIIDMVIDVLVKKDMVKTLLVENKDYLLFYLTESKIQLNKNMKLMIKNTAEYLLDHCNENEIEHIEKNELQKISEIDNDSMFEDILKYLVERHFADIEEDSEDGKTYVTIHS